MHVAVSSELEHTESIKVTKTQIARRIRITRCNASRPFCDNFHASIFFVTVDSSTVNTAKSLHQLRNCAGEFLFHGIHPIYLHFYIRPVTNCRNYPAL